MYTGICNCSYLFKFIRITLQDFFSNFGKPGAGAPIVNSNGERMTELPADSSIRFQDSKEGKKINEIEVRYREPAARKMNMRRDLGLYLKKKKLSTYASYQSKNLNKKKNRIVIFTKKKHF